MRSGILKRLPRSNSARSSRNSSTFNKKYFADDTLKIQKTAMRDGELRYDGHGHRGVIKILFVINKCLECFSPQATDFSILEMAEEVMPNTLKRETHLDFIQRGSDKLTKKKDIIDVVAEVSNYLGLKHNVEQEKSHSNKDNQNRREKNGGGSCNSGDQPCCKHEKLQA